MPYVQQRLRNMLEQVGADPRSGGPTNLLEGLAVGGGADGVQLDARSARRRGAEAEIAAESLDVLARDEELDGDQRFVLEAIVMPYHRPVVDIFDNRMKIEHLTQKWRRLADDELRTKIERCLLSVGRINVPSLPSLPYAGTGFVVGPNLLMTNRHVASIFASGVGDRRIDFRAGQTAAFDFYHELGRTESLSLMVKNVKMIHPYWDMALLEVAGLPADREPLVLSTHDPADMVNREIFVVGYPGYDPKGDDEFQRVQNRIFRGSYYVKRLQPGLLKQRVTVESYKKPVEAITHDCSTLGGNSGSAVFVLPRTNDEAIQVVGLHFAGEYLVANYAVSTFDLAQDTRVVDTGVRFSGVIQPRQAFYAPHWKVPDAAVSLDAASSSAGSSVQSIRASSVTPSPGSAGTIVIDVPLRLSVTLGTPSLITPSTVGRTDAGALSAEGIFGGEAPLPTASLPYSFSLSSLSATKFDWKLALSLALASRLAYEDAPAVERTACERWGFDRCRFFEADDTQCFVASTSKVILLAFRGTLGIGDWLADLNLLSSTRSYGTVHRGFLNAFNDVEPLLLAELARLPDRSLILTGHSLGGALATITTAQWHEKHPISWAYTYGQPAVGRKSFVRFMRRYVDQFQRFVNDDDIIARLPPTYSHVGHLIRFDGAGNVQGVLESPGRSESFASSESAGGSPMLTESQFDHLRAQLLEQRATHQAVGLESLSEPRVEGLFPSVKDHDIDNYLARIAAFV